MGTTSRIAIANQDGSFTSIYCHWDGYPEGVGQTLVNHYTSEEKIRQLLALGDLSSLEREIGTKHDFDNPPEGECTFYGRDRGEKGCGARKSRSLEALGDTAQNCGADYLYLFEDGAWKVAEIGMSSTPIGAFLSIADAKRR